MCDFKKEDVLILAKAILEEPLEYVDGDFESYYYCVYCAVKLKGYFVNMKDFKHDLNCPVLVAKDILTGTK